MGIRGPAFVAGVCAVGVAISGAVAQGEVGEGSALIPPHLSIAPVTLPRDHRAPVALSFGPNLLRAGTPSITDFKLELSRNFEIDAEAVPTCGIRQLSGTTEGEAERACAGSIVGHGSEARLLPGSSGEALGEHARITLFNGRYQGGPAILAHGVIESTQRAFLEPIPISTQDGWYATALSIEPRRGFPGGTFTSIDLTLGRPHLRYLLGKCPLPPETHIGEFKLAHMSTEFADGTTITDTVERPCKARG